MKATIVDAALATSAATTFFDEVEINGEKFCDGAFGANNPVDQVYIEASSIWDDMGGQLSSALKCFISIGTGVPGVDAMREDVAGFLSKTLKAMVTETERTQQRFMKRNKDVAKPDGKQRFFRFNVEQGLQGVGLAEYLRQGSIKAATNRYMESLQQITLVRLCSEHLRQKQCTSPVHRRN
jgi:predicted patatin/cPLA2 family phospholipase